MVKTNVSLETPLSKKKKTYHAESNSTDLQYAWLTDFKV